MKLKSAEILNLIAKLTDHRDLDALEINLLKTMSEQFEAAWASIYHVIDDDEPQFAVAIHGPTIIHEAFPESYQHMAELPGVTAFPIVGKMRQARALLLVQRKPALSKSERKLITHMLRIYDNYITVLRDSQLDRLTGLLNRHTFDVQLEKALQQIRRKSDETDALPPRRKVEAQKGCFYLGELDIDHFKKINDQFGHLYGDEVLIILANILQASFRKTDLIYRFGGEEFVVIVYVEDRNDAIVTFERLRQRIESYDFPQVGRVTVSIGVTAIKNTSVPVELLGHADQALYYAKQNGRNRVCFYEILVGARELEAHTSSSDVTIF